MTFFKGLSANTIADETGIERKRVFRALLHTREAMAKDIPDVFSGTVEIDETYIGGQWKNKRKSQKITKAKRGRGTKKTPVFGILCRNGKVWAEVVPDVEAKTLIPLVSQRVKIGSTVCSDTWKSYTGIAAKGYVHRIVKHSQNEYSDGKGNHINGLEGFWGYLKRRLMAI
jgi:transposase